jgi:hypothetical protein
VCQPSIAAIGIAPADPLYGLWAFFAGTGLEGSAPGGELGKIVEIGNETRGVTAPMIKFMA